MLQILMRIQLKIMHKFQFLKLLLRIIYRKDQKEINLQELSNLFILFHLTLTISILTGLIILIIRLFNRLMFLQERTMILQKVYLSIIKSLTTHWFSIHRSGSHLLNKELKKTKEEKHIYLKIRLWTLISQEIILVLWIITQQLQAILVEEILNSTKKKEKELLFMIHHCSTSIIKNHMIIKQSIKDTRPIMCMAHFLTKLMSLQTMIIKTDLA